MITQNPILTIAKYSVLEAIRDRFLLFIVMGILLFFGLALFIAELAITEGVETQTAILATALRFFAIFTTSLFVITSMLREFHDKGFELILSHPLPRASYYFGKYLGFASTALIVVLMIGFCLSIYAPVIAVLFWSLSLFCELLIIIAFSLLCLFSFGSTPIAFSVVFCFYWLARSIEVILLISESPIIASPTLSHQLLQGGLELIAYLIPNLYAFTKTEWLVYALDAPISVVMILGQTLIYTSLLSAAALFDLYRKAL